MGKINILKAGYEGKVGQTYGVAKKGLYDIKAIPFSHTPHNNKQSKAKNQFTGLNRIASKVVKKMWSYLGLSDKNMYRNNALCQHWKNALKGEEFRLENLKEVISQDDALRIDEVLYDPQTFAFTYSANEINQSEETDNQIIYIAIVTNENVTKVDIAEKGNTAILSSMFDYIDFAYFQVWAFKAVQGIKNWQLKGLSISDPVFVIIANEIIYLSRWRWNSEPYVKDEILYLDSDNIHVENEIIYF